MTAGSKKSVSHGNRWKPKWRLRREINRSEYMQSNMPSKDQKQFKARILVWADLSLVNVDELMKCENTSEDIQSLLADIFNLGDYKKDLRAGILADLYYYTIQFAKDNDFTKEQTSAFFSIVKCVHEMAVDTPYGNVDAVFQFFKELLLCHSVKRPPFSVAFFSVDQVKKITSYVINSYFRHFKLYKYAFTPKVRLDLTFEYVGLPETPVPSEAGGEGSPDAAETGEEAAGEEQPVEEGSVEDEIEDTPAMKELKAMISSSLNEQVQQLKSSVEKQIREKDEELSKKFGISPDGRGTPKSPKAKGKKGK